MSEMRETNLLPEEQVPELTILDLTDLPNESARQDGSGAAEAEPKGRHRSPVSDGKPPPTGPPTSAEWQDFLGGIVLRLLTEGYLSITLWREIDESELTERERELVRLTKDDLNNMAAPMASFAAKNKTARKHGRVIIAGAESAESLIDLFIWMRRVNKIAKKYHKNQPQEAERTQDNGNVPGADREASENRFTILNRGTG